MLHEVSVDQLQFNPFTKIGKEWLLITAGDEHAYNTMTASWGTVGVLWGKPVATVYIRPSRHTLSFVEEHDRLTLSFFPQEQHKALAYCGAHSGREVDKAKETGLTPLFLDGTTTFAEANLVFVCKKLYCSDLQAKQFLDTEALKFYTPEQGGFHRAFVVEIEKVYQQ